MNTHRIGISELKFTFFFQENPLSPECGSTLREKLLQHGGGLEPREMVSDCLGSALSPAALVDALVTELDSKAERATAK